MEVESLNGRNTPPTENGTVEEMLDQRSTDKAIFAEIRGTIKTKNQTDIQRTKPPKNEQAGPKPSLPKPNAPMTPSPSHYVAFAVGNGLSGP